MTDHPDHPDRPHGGDGGLGGALARYAERLHARAGAESHHVVSPLGAWMVIAMAATAAEGDTRAALADVLGLDPEMAAGWVRRLLGDRHPLVAAGAGVWVRPLADTPQLKQWRTGLSGTVDTGDIPTQAQLDAWAERRTLGLLPRFLLEVTDEVVCLLATALATTVSWEVPFEVLDAAELGPAAHGPDGCAGCCAPLGIPGTASGWPTPTGPGSSPYTSPAHGAGWSSGR